MRDRSTRVQRGHQLHHRGYPGPLVQELQVLLGVIAAEAVQVVHHPGLHRPYAGHSTLQPVEGGAAVASFSASVLRLARPSGGGGLAAPLHLERHHHQLLGQLDERGDPSEHAPSKLSGL